MNNGGVRMYWRLQATVISKNLKGDIDLHTPYLDFLDNFSENPPILTVSMLNALRQIIVNKHKVSLESVIIINHYFAKVDTK